MVPKANLCYTIFMFLQKKKIYFVNWEQHHRWPHGTYIRDSYFFIILTSDGKIDNSDDCHYCPLSSITKIYIINHKGLGPLSKEH